MKNIINYVNKKIDRNNNNIADNNNNNNNNSNNNYQEDLSSQSRYHALSPTIYMESNRSNNTYETGNYKIQVHIIELRDLKPRDGDTSACNPFCEIKIAPFGLKKASKLKTNTFNARFNETLNFNFNVEDTKEITVGRILITVFNYKKIFTQTIGSFQFGIDDVYNRPGHEYFKEWVALSDPNDNESNGVRGYMKISVTALGPNDKQVGHSLDEIESDDNYEKDKNGWEVIKNCTYSKAMKLKTWGLKAYIYKAEHLPATDFSSLYRKNVCDPYVTMQFGDLNEVVSTAKTKVIPQTQNPIWDAGSYIYLRANLPDFVANSSMLPISSQFVQLAVNDEHLGNEKDTRISTSFISFKNLIQDRINLLLADRALSGFFHPNIVDKKKNLLMQKFKLKDLSSNAQLTDKIDIVAGMFVKRKDTKQLFQITKVDHDSKVIHVTLVETSSPLPVAHYADVAEISTVTKRDYKEYWMLPPLVHAKPFWLNLYGSSDYEGDQTVARLINEGRKDGTCYRGRVCMTLHLFESESSELVNQKGGNTTGVLDTQYFELKHAMELLPPVHPLPLETKYRLVFRPIEGSMLYCASSLIDRYLGNEEVCVVVQVGSYIWKSKSSMISKGLAEWNDSFLDTVMTLPSDPIQIPDMFVYLERASGSRKGKRISYLRFNMNDYFIGLQSKQVTKKQPVWYPLTEDPVLKLVPFGEFPGQLLISSAFGLEDDKGWSVIPRDIVSFAMIKKTSYFFWLHLFQGSNLMPSSLSLTCDPYVFVSCGNSDAISIVRKSTAYPIWNQSIGFRVDEYPNPNNLERGSPIFISILDKNSKFQKTIGNFWYSPQKAYENAIDFVQTNKFTVSKHVIDVNGYETATINAAFQLFEVNENQNPNPDPVIMRRIVADEFSKLNPILVPPEFHPQSCTIIIELLGLREMLLGSFSNLLSIKEPKITFEVGGIKTVFDATPSFIANGNFNFGETTLPVITIETKLLYSDWNIPCINIEVTNGIFNTFIGRGAIELPPDFFMAEDLEEALNDVSSATTNASSRISSFASISQIDEKDDLINPDQDLSGYDIDDEDVPGVVAENKPNTALNKLVSLMDHKFVAKVDKNFFASREAQSKFDIDTIATSKLDIDEKKVLLESSSSPESVKTENLSETSASYIPLRARKGKLLQSSSSPQSISSESLVSSVAFVPLRNRVTSSAIAVSSSIEKIDEVKNIDQRDVKEIEIEMEKNLSESNKKVTFQDFLKNSRKEGELESNVELDGFINNSNNPSTLSEFKSFKGKKDAIDVDYIDDGDFRWYMLGRKQVDNELEETLISCIDTPNQTRSPSNWAENIVCMIEMIYQTYFDKIRSQPHNHLSQNMQSLLLNTRSEIIKNNDSGSYNFRGPFACNIKKVFCNLTADQNKLNSIVSSASPIKGILHQSSVKNSDGRSSPSNQENFSPIKVSSDNSNNEIKIAIDSPISLKNHKLEIELTYIVETPTMADNKGICLLTSRCIICGLEESAHCGCTANFLRGRKNKSDLISVCLVYPPALPGKTAPEPIIRCFCHHPVCWMQRKSLIKMWSQFKNETEMKFPKDFYDLKLNLELRPALSDNFQTCSLYRGKKQNSLAVGLIKAKIKLYKGWERFDVLKRRQIHSTDLIKRDTYRIRVYILRGMNLSGNNGKNVNSYLVLKLGNETINTNNSSDQPLYANRSSCRPVVWGKVENTPNPDYSRYGCIEFSATIPGESLLNISVLDLNIFGRDYEIGSTSIDLEQRVLSLDNLLQYPPIIERRSLIQSDNTNHISRGKLEMWVEVLPSNLEITYPVLDIVPPPPSMWELRVIIYECDGVPNYDSVTEANDMYVRVQVEGGEWKETDIHIRARDGKGAFNWRMKFPIQLPLPETMTDRLKIQVWDKDLVESDDAIAEAYLDLKPAFRKAIQTHKKIVLHNDWRVKEPENMEWFKLSHPNSGFSSVGRIRFSAEILPIKMADTLQNGSGQTAPNKYPFLPPPEGRPEWNWMKPHLILLNIIGPAMFANIQRYFCLPVVGIPLFLVLGYILSLVFVNFGL